MHYIRPAFRASALLLTLIALGGCSGMGNFDFSGSSSQPVKMEPSAPPASMSGRWLLSSPGRGQCHMTFGAAAPNAVDGTIAPEGGCPGKFFTSRKWTYDQSGLTMRDHNSQPLAQLSGDGAQYNGKAASGEPVTLAR